MKNEAKKELIVGKFSATKDLIEKTLQELEKECNSDKVSSELQEAIKGTECFVMTSVVDYNEYNNEAIVNIDRLTSTDDIKLEKTTINILNENRSTSNDRPSNTFMYRFLKSSCISFIDYSYYLNYLSDNIKEKLNCEDISTFDFFIVQASPEYKKYDINIKRLEKEFEDSKEDFCNLMNSRYTTINNNCKFFTIKNDNSDLSVLLAVKSFISIYELGIKNKISKLFKGNVPLDGIDLKISDLDLVSLNWSFCRDNKMSNSPLFLYIQKENLNLLQAKVLESILNLVANTVSAAGYKLKKSELNPGVVEVIPDEDAIIKLETILNKLQQQEKEE